MKKLTTIMMMLAMILLLVSCDNIFKEKYKVQFKNLAAAQIELLETESFQIRMMNPPKVEQPEVQTKEVTPKAPSAPSEKEEEIPKIDISFTNVASNPD